MKVVIDGETFHGSTKELCVMFGCNRPQDLPKAIEIYRQNHRLHLLNDTVSRPKTKPSKQTFNE